MYHRTHVDSIVQTMHLFDYGVSNSLIEFEVFPPSPGSLPQYKLNKRKIQNNIN